MKSELVVDVQQAEVTIALLEDDKLVEVNREKRSQQYSVGDIYWGKVTKVMPALNAAFVDVGHGKDAFLHYNDLGAKFLTIDKYVTQYRKSAKSKPQMNKIEWCKDVAKESKASRAEDEGADKRQTIEDYVKVGQELMVQIIKEPINTKGPRVTAELSIAGRNIVLMPFAEKVMVSGKIESEAEKTRLKHLVTSVKPNGYGVIVRTQAEGKRVAEIDEELKLLVQRWEDSLARIIGAQPHTLIVEEIGRTIGVIRDLFSTDFENIYVNDKDMYAEIRDYITLIAPEKKKIVHWYKDDKPIFDHFDLTMRMKTGLGRTVGIGKGGYLIMERTEALFSIDVNSGSKKIAANQEDNVFLFNMMAAEEIAHQLRLRDIGGIIIVDFIDMSSDEHNLALYKKMQELMGKDRARHNILPLSKFGLMQITRQRVRPVLEVEISETCPTCGGTGKIQVALDIVSRIEHDLQERIDAATLTRGAILQVHPYFYAYACKGLLSSIKQRWHRKYGVKLQENQALGMLEWRVVKH